MDNQKERATAGAWRSITKPAPGMLRAGGARQPWKATHLGEGNSDVKPTARGPHCHRPGLGQFARTVLHLKIPQRRPKDTSTFSMTNHPKSPTAMGKGRKRQVEDVTRSRSIDPACRRLRTLVAWLSTRRRRHHPAVS